MRDTQIVTTALPAASQSLRSILKSDWRWLIAGATLCVMLASVLMSGWPLGLLPNMEYPYTYAGDGISHSWVAKRAIEGWVFDNVRSGFPFGSNFLDYPGSDSGNLFILKMLGTLTGEYHRALNLYFLLSFAATFIAACAVMQSFGLARPWAMAAAILFNFVPFHFQRIGHLFYTWYFVVPIFFYIAVKLIGQLASGEGAHRSFSYSAFSVLGLLVLGCFGVYYAIFGMIILAVAAMTCAFSGKAGRPAMLRAGGALLFVAAGVFLNIAPNILHQRQVGVNPEVAQRKPADAEVLGLKMTQLFLPRPDHRIPIAADYANLYLKNFPLANENYTSTLGVIGSVGFIAALLAVFAATIACQVDRNLKFIALLTLVLFLFGTVGGFGSLFSQFVSPSIRGWNRISIFIAFGALSVFFLGMQACIQRYAKKKQVILVSTLTSLGILAVGLLDQTVQPCIACNQLTKLNFERDRTFVQAIERLLPAQSAVFQLPYMEFPEVPPRFGLDTYDLAAGYLHSHSLRWSYAGMRGREGDLFFRALSKESVVKQIEVLRRLGFGAVYIDRRGYKDNGAEIIQQFSEILGHQPLVQRNDGQVLVFSLGRVSDATAQRVRDARSALELMTLADYVVDRMGSRYKATFAEGIDFTRPDFPSFVKDMSGLSGPEPWGRWSDASLTPTVKLTLSQTLPDRFTLVLKAQAFGPNTGKQLQIRVGSQVLGFFLKEGVAEYRQVVRLHGQKLTQIEIISPQPVSPKELSASTDDRKLGVGLVRLAFE